MTVDYHKAPYFADPETGFELKPLAPGDEDRAAGILASATGEKSAEAARQVMDRAGKG